MSKILGITCPKCGSNNTLVSDSRPKKHTVKRRRGCLDCGYSFLTTEYNTEMMPQPQSILRIKIRKDGRLFNYDRIKIKADIQSYCSISVSVLNKVLYTMERLMFLDSTGKESIVIIEHDDYQRILKICLLYFDWASFVAFMVNTTSIKTAEEFIVFLKDTIEMLKQDKNWSAIS